MSLNFSKQLVGILKYIAQHTNYAIALQVRHGWFTSIFPSYMNNKNIHFLLSVTLLLGACSGMDDREHPAPVYGSNSDSRYEATSQPEVSTQALPVEEAPIHTQQLDEYDSDTDPMIIAPGKSSNLPAVVALMSQADASSKQGDLETAVATVERALRIEPRNAVLVYKLAALRLEQNKPGLAIDLAKKSALLASNDKGLKKSCWLLIADARKLQGDNYGAAEAKQKAAKYNR